MICFPPAKINLGLYIVSKRTDGFHNLETIFYPLPFRDALEIIPAKETLFIQTGLQIPGATGDNLVMRAYRMMREKYPQIAGLEIHLHKVIPPGAGLGGGSSDAAGLIQLINRFYDLQIPSQTLKEYALTLGSDCPFFLQSGACFASGRGEILEPVTLDLSDYSMLLVHPELHIDTAWAFSRMKPAAPEYDLRKSIQEPVLHWNQTISNGFETTVFETYPVLQKIKERLYASGALYASMTGSGSTLFGIFPKSDFQVFEVEQASVTFLR
jgi:4-diphosphocytidyl-2-C-methyl-D-erythritol kinase